MGIGSASSDQPTDHSPSGTSGPHPPIASVPGLLPASPEHESSSCRRGVVIDLLPAIGAAWDGGDAWIPGWSLPPRTGLSLYAQDGPKFASCSARNPIPPHQASSLPLCSSPRCAAMQRPALGITLWPPAHPETAGGPVMVALVRGDRCAGACRRRVALLPLG